MRSIPLWLRLALLGAAFLLVASIGLVESPRAPGTAVRLRLETAADSLCLRLHAQPVHRRWVESPTGVTLDFSLMVDGARLVPSLVRIRPGNGGRPVVRGVPRSLPAGGFPAAPGIDPLALACAQVDTAGGLRGRPISHQSWFRSPPSWRPGWVVQIPLAAYQGEALPWREAPPQVGSPVDLELRFDDAGALLEARDLLIRAAVGRGRVFDPNPIVASGREDLRDGDPVDVWQVPVDLPGLESDRLWGQRVHVESGNRLKAVEPGLVFEYPSSDPRFEEVMAYYHIDRARSWLESLGYGGYFGAPQAVTVHAAPIDNSWYSPITKRIEFGDGGVDDAEDADILVHELGHAVHDAFVPGFGEGDSRAISEGFADYLAATRSGDPCVAEWDATAYSPPCLRRVDLDLHEPEDRTGSSHADGRIWSGALWAIRYTLGAPLADRIALEGLLRQAPDSSFREAALALMEAVDALGLTSERETVRAILVSRGLLLRTGQIHLAGEGREEIPLDRPWPTCPGAESVAFAADGAVEIGDLTLRPLLLGLVEEVSIDYEVGPEGFGWSWELRSIDAQATGSVLLGWDGALEMSWGKAPETETWPDGIVEVVRIGEPPALVDVNDAFVREALPPSFRWISPSGGTRFGGARLRLVPSDAGWNSALVLPPSEGSRTRLRVLGQPARGSARIRVDLSEAVTSVPAIFDASGRQVRRLRDLSARSVGPQLLVWDGTDDQGRSVASGVYWIRVPIQRGAVSAKILFLDR